MIRQDPDRPSVFVIDVSTHLIAELTEDWSEPVRVRIENGELVFRVIEADRTDWLLELEPGLAITVTVHTREPDVVAAVEKAAFQAGLQLQPLPLRGD